MKRAHRLAVLVTLMSSVVVAWYLCTTVIMRYINAAPVTVHIDPIFASLYESHLTHTIEEDIHKNGAAMCVTQAAARYSVLSDIIVHYRFPLRGIASCAAHEPCCIFNNATALLEDGIVVSAGWYTSDSMHMLPHVHIDPTMLMSGKAAPELVNFCIHLNHDIATRFVCHWHDEENALLADSKHPRYTLVCSGTNPPTTDDIGAYDRLVEHLDATVPKKQWRVDMRFLNQVIISADGGK
jgi:hypothetical protein